MKTLFLSFSLLFAANGFASIQLPVCDMDAIQAPCQLSEVDTAVYALAMLMTNVEGLALLEQISDDIVVPEEEDPAKTSFTGTMLESSEDKQVVQLFTTMQCKPDRNCKEYQWKVLLEIEEDNDKITNEMIRIE